MNIIYKHRLVSCSTQTHSKENIRHRKSKMPSFKNLRLKIDNSLLSNIDGCQISNNLKGKKVLKKKKVLDIYNSIYNNKNFLFFEKIENRLEHNNKNNKHKKGEIALSFCGGDKSLNKKMIDKFNSVKTNDCRIFTKYPDKNSNNIIVNKEKKNKEKKENKYRLINKQVYDLPLYNVSKILTNTHNKNSLLYNNMESSNCFDNSKNIDKFPIIFQKNDFDSTDIKKENDKILKNLFRSNCINKKKINKDILKMKCFNRNIFDKNKLFNCITKDNHIFFNNNLIESNLGKIYNEIKSIKKKVKKISKYSHNKTSDNLVLSNEY